MRVKTSPKNVLMSLFTEERFTVPGTGTVVPNLFVPITTLNSHVTMNITTTMSHIYILGRNIPPHQVKLAGLNIYIIQRRAAQAHSDKSWYW